MQVYEPEAIRKTGLMLKSVGLKRDGNCGCNPDADGVHPEYYLVTCCKFLG
jgi:hypothetical protein